MQKAIDISYSKVDGALNLSDLADLLIQGWEVVQLCQSGGGDILAILEKPADKPSEPS